MTMPPLPTQGDTSWYDWATAVDTEAREVAGKADASHTHSVVDLTATGSRTSSTFLRGDNTWAVPEGGEGAGADPIYLNVKDYGAVGDGSTNDTAAINAAIAALPALTGTFGPSAGTLFFPAGRYMTDGGHVLPDGKCVQVRGEGPYNSTLYRRTGATGDMLTLRASYSGVSDLTLDGGNVSTAGDGLVLDAAYTSCRNATITGHQGTGIAIGKTSGAIIYRLEGVIVRRCKGIGIYVHPSTGSTDGQMVNVDVGLTGLNGVKLQTAAQILTNVHVWQAGLETTTATAQAGFYLNGPKNLLSNCESETNNGAGILISSAGADGNGISNCDIWGNGRQGIYSFGGTKWQTITGNRIRDNGVRNTTASTSATYAAIHNEDGSEWSITGNVIYDSGDDHSAGTEGTQPYPGRAATVTTSRAYVEAAVNGTPTGNVLAGNTWGPTSLVSGTPTVLVGTTNRVSGNSDTLTEGLVVHDGTAGGGTRPLGFYRVRWIGGTARPTNMANGDIWEH